MDPIPTDVQPAPGLQSSAPPKADSEASVHVVDEAVLAKRIRRPLDLVRLVAAISLATITFLFAWFAAGTTAGIEEDIGEATTRLPDPVILVLNVIAGFGLLALPVAVAVDLLARRRPRQLFDALLGLFIAVVLLTAGAILVDNVASDEVRIALAGSLSGEDDAVLPLLGGLVAFITVAGLMSRRRWNLVALLVVSSLILVSLFTGNITAAGIAVTALVGWATGVGTRYAVGTTTTRPPGVQVARIIVRSGLPLVALEAIQSTEIGRRYQARLADGRVLDVVVLDRDLEGAGLAQSIWTNLRLRPAVSGGAFNMRAELERRALMSYAAEVAGLRPPRLLLASEVGPDAAVLLYERAPGQTFADLGEDLSDEDLRAAFQMLATMQSNQLAHRQIAAEQLLRRPDGQVVPLAIGGGTIAAGDVVARIDIAEVLCTLALLVGVERTLAVGRDVLGEEHMGRALPVLQPVALNPATRTALKGHKDTLVSLRDGLTELRPDAAMEQIRLERIKPRTLITVVLGSVAGYLLLSQLAQVDLVTLFEQADWWWLAVAMVFSLSTYPGSAWAIMGFVPERIKLLPAALAQIAADFATLVTPPTLGTVAINLRFLQKQGIHPALATASLGVSQVAALIVHIMFLLAFGIAAGTRADLAFSPPREVVLGAAAVIVAVVAILMLPIVRNRIWGKFGPLLKQIGPRMVTLVQRPLKLVEGIGGLSLVNLGYIGTLAACVFALGGELNLAAIGFVYLTGSVIGQAAPTPGGLGAVEAAMAAGLTAVGLDSGVAVSAVLMYRVITFWLPTIPGWFALNHLQRKNLL